MNIQTLVTTMNLNDEDVFRLAKNNNLEGEVIIGDQCGFDGLTKGGNTSGGSITILKQATRGVSKNRNSLLDYSNSDIITFADDDLRFSDHYSSMVQEAFERFPKAEIIRFNIFTDSKDRPIKQISKNGLLHFLDVRSFGVWGFFIKRKFLVKHHIRFDENVGPGLPINHGEDTLFLRDCFKRTKAIYQIDSVIGYLSMGESSWYGKDLHQELRSVGYLYARLFPIMNLTYGMRFLDNHRKTYASISRWEQWKLFNEGRKIFFREKKKKS
jgi:glycosyltransferase involved in cell wall biosynthesis